MERDELIEEISRRKGIAKKEDVHAWNNHNIPCRCSVCTFCP